LLEIAETIDPPQCDRFPGIADRYGTMGA